ncbi:MAG: secondary thiamine-phosphate synthase enzyme YjbQ [Myxococcales bacterium]|nr:secondary thiamine-phosphate synthase enzyme YjbQ [Myxococcales bacterium]
MSVYCENIVVRTRGRGMIEITEDVARIVHKSRFNEGIAHIFIKHTSASLFINENADPDVLKDLERFLSDLVPDGDARFVHTAEGPDDMPAHIRSVLTSAFVAVPIRNHRLSLGTWQGIYVWEHRDSRHTRELQVTLTA